MVAIAVDSTPPSDALVAPPVHSPTPRVTRRWATSQRWGCTCLLRAGRREGVCSFTPFAHQLNLKSSASSSRSILRRFKSPEPATSSYPSINPFMAPPLSIPSSFTMVHLKTCSMLSIPTTISPKFGLIRNASSTSLASLANKLSEIVVP
ncbi:hypothetical protein EDB84DRAFT_151863 [Lactarius hengduanensis]|nr:hypothetical protein EDB84DRAFT_151863 [Lactarius hengduanensis]